MDVKKVFGVDLYSYLPEEKKRQLNEMRERMKTVRTGSPIKNSAFDEMMIEGLEKIKNKIEAHNDHKQ